MMYLLIENGIIINRIMWDGETPYPLQPNQLLVKAEGDIGWKWDGEKAIDPNPPSEIVAKTSDDEATVF